MVFLHSDVVCFVIGGNNWLISLQAIDDNVLLSVDLDSLLFDQDGLLDHARLGLLDNVRLRQGNDVLLVRLLGLLELFRFLDLFLLAIDDDLTAHNDGHSSNDIGSDFGEEKDALLHRITFFVWIV